MPRHDSYGLIVEGVFDAAAFEELVRKLSSAEADIRSFTCGGAPNLIKLVVGRLRILERIRNGSPVEKAIIVRDANLKDPVALQQRIEETIQNHHFNFPAGVDIFIVRQELEALLLADENAISTITTSRGGRRVQRINRDLEQVHDPKQLLRQVLATGRLEYYTPEVCREIARESDIEAIRYRCPSFDSFINMVADC